MKHFLAVDIGASSGRHIVADEDNNLDEIYRFETGFEYNNGHLINNIDKLVDNVIKGIKIAFEKYKNIESMSIDTWGVDYVLLNNDKIIYPVYSYRDERTLKIIDEVHSKISFNRLYRKTGIQFQPFNTIYQLYDDLLNHRLDNATDFLLLPDYLIYYLTGVKCHEYTNSTTTGLVSNKKFDSEIIDALNLPKHLFKELDVTGKYVAKLKEDVEKEVGGNCKVILCASHDTASAVEGIPMEDGIYISSGTWSLFGVKVNNVISDDNSRNNNYSNEGGVGYIRYQKNIMGMWVINNLKKELYPDMDFMTLIENAKKSKVMDIVDINKQIFFSPNSMKDAFDKELNKSFDNGFDYFKIAFLSLAESYKNALIEIENNTKKKYDKIYIVGGGAKNQYLNQLTEEFTKVKVIALPIEASSLGNIKIQEENLYE